MRVALLQGNIPQELKFSPQRYAATLATYRRLIAASNAQLIVLPETAIPRFLDAIEPRYLDDIGRMARQKHADLLIGVPLRERGDRYFNSVVSMGTSPAQNYSKSHLVPFGEFVPPGFGWIVSMLAIPLSDFSRGTDRPEPMALWASGSRPISATRTPSAREIIRQLPEATLLVNISNVAWFGDSLAPAQHLQIARMRALETGRYMLRSTNTGVTAIIDARGKVQARLDQFTEGVLQGEVQGFCRRHALRASRQLRDRADLHRHTRRARLRPAPRRWSRGTKPVKSVASRSPCSLFQDLILKLQTYWDRRAARCCSPTTWKSAPAPRTPRLSCARSARSRGARPTCSPRAAPRTAATATTPTGCSTTTSTRWC